MVSVEHASSVADRKNAFVWVFVALLCVCAIFEDVKRIATITNAAVGACDKGGQKEKALQLFT
jgi:hypothetical protein